MNDATAYAVSSCGGNKNTFNNGLAKFNEAWLYNDLTGELTGTKGDILYKL